MWPIVPEEIYFNNTILGSKRVQIKLASEPGIL